MKPIVTNPACDCSPAWSADGEEIVFDSDRNGNFDVWVVSVKNGTVRQLTDNETYEGMASWSPDGETIAYISWHKRTEEIHVTPAKGGNAKQLTNFEGFGMMRPVWSLDGKTIYTKYIPFSDRQRIKIIAVNVQDGTFRTIFDFDVEGRLDFTLATDNKNLYFKAGLFKGEDELWLADLVYE